MTFRLQSTILSSGIENVCQIYMTKCKFSQVSGMFSNNCSRFRFKELNCLNPLNLPLLLLTWRHTTCLFGHLGHISNTKEKSTSSPKDWSCWTISHFKSINSVIPKQFSNLRHLPCKRQNTYLKFLKNAISKHNFGTVHVNWPMRAQALVI